jgi:hypothetical protein
MAVAAAGLPLRPFRNFLPASLAAAFAADRRRHESRRREKRGKTFFFGNLKKSFAELGRGGFGVPWRNFSEIFSKIALMNGLAWLKRHEKNW